MPELRTNLTIDPQRLWDTLMETAQIRRDGQGRHQPADADRRRQAGARLVQGAVRGARLHGHGRRGRQHVRARGPAGNDDAAADRHGLASRHPADRRQVRRRARRARRARSDAHAGHEPATRPTRRSRSSTGPTRRARASRRRCSRSGVFAGVFTPDYAYARADRDGKTLRRRAGAHRLPGRGEGRRAQASARCSSCTSSRARSSRPRSKMIGVVTGVQGMRWYEVTVTGQEAHTGATPMQLRKNALLGAARMIERDRRDRAWRTRRRGRHRRPDREPAEQPQRRAGRGVLHRRLPPSRRGGARRHGDGVPRGAAARSLPPLEARPRGEAHLELAGGASSLPS